MGSVLAMKKVKTQSVKRKKSRKSRRDGKYGDGTCSKINEVNESGDEENNEPIQQLEIKQDAKVIQMDGADKIHPALYDFGLSQDVSIPVVAGQPLNKK